MDFLRIFLSLPPDFFADLFCRLLFLLIIVRKVPRKILQQNPPDKSRLKPPIRLISYNKNPRHISAKGPGQNFVKTLELGQHMSLPFTHELASAHEVQRLKTLFQKCLLVRSDLHPLSVMRMAQQTNFRVVEKALCYPVQLLHTTSEDFRFSGFP